jgi:hypothetical protein
MSVVITVPPGSAEATTSASTAEPRRASLRRSAARRGEDLRDNWDDVASLEELVLDGVAARVALQTLHENDGGDVGWP